MHKKTGDEKMDLALKKSLKYSILDGSLFSLMMGSGEYYLGAYLILLGATNEQIGLFGTLPQFLGAVIQILGTKLIKITKSRKLAVLI